MLVFRKHSRAPRNYYIVLAETMEANNSYNPSSQPAPNIESDNTTQQRRKQNNRRENWRSITSTLAILISAPIIALLLITFVFQSYVVDGPSMMQTLQDNDRLIVVKTGKTIATLQNEAYIPDRGDIIVFARFGTFDPIAGGERQLIKRVVGLPGERITVKSGVVTVFNEEFPDGFNPDTTGGYDNLLASRGGDKSVDITIPDGHVFVMGDNRSNSQDSRVFGPVDSSEIIGRLALRIYPFDSATTF